MRFFLAMMLVLFGLAGCGQQAATSGGDEAAPTTLQGSAPPPKSEAAPADTAETPQQAVLENAVYLDTKYGRVTIKLRPDLAPKAVERIKVLTKRGFYNGLKFHRVIGGFMAQTGDPKGDGTGGSDLPDLPAEFSNAPFSRGAVGMARSSDPNSANSQFFICYSGCGHLTGQYTLVGYVTDGMDAVEKLKRGNAAFNGRVAVPDIIEKMQMASDAK